MKVCGITAEYNPFHNGHRYQIEKTKEKTGADVILAVMSGNFVQRGEPAVIDKWERAKAAVLNGVDVVIELPNIYALQAASRFAHGSVTLLKAAQVDCISFGSECGNLENLQESQKRPSTPTTYGNIWQRVFPIRRPIPFSLPAWPPMIFLPYPI